MYAGTVFISYVILVSCIQILTFIYIYIYIYIYFQSISAKVNIQQQQ
jgi:hypothetical protein